MHQVLFTIPVAQSAFPPDGIPVYGFGAMLFITFVVCTLWGARRGKPVGMPPEKIQDMFIWIFVAGIIGARVLYMIQYAHQFPNSDLVALAGAFFQIWKGGIIFYGSALGGVIGYALFYHFVIRRMSPHVSGWQLADAMVPIICLGLAIGRIGCYLNGCCWGQVAIEETCPVPLGGANFPLLPAHAREQLVRDQGLQSTTGFTVVPRDRSLPGADPRSVVAAVEPHSSAARAGLAAGDRIVGVNGEPNALIVEVMAGDAEARALDELGKRGGQVEPATPERRGRASFTRLEDFTTAVLAVRREVPGVTLSETDRLSDLVKDWPRGRHDLTLQVERGSGEPITLDPFVPRTVSLYPTQLYETLSMVLLIGLLLAYHPFRRHDGQVMVLGMIGYAVHRFINESIRIEPAVGLGLTLSQWGSVVILAAAIGIELHLRRTMPSRWVVAPPSQVA